LIAKHIHDVKEHTEVLYLFRKARGGSSALPTTTGLKRTSLKPS
jgi:hypothetical protein